MRDENTDSFHLNNVSASLDIYCVCLVFGYNADDYISIIFCDMFDSRSGYFSHLRKCPKGDAVFLPCNYCGKLYQRIDTLERHKVRNLHQLDVFARLC